MRATIFISSGLQFVIALAFLHTVLSLKGEVYGEELATGLALFFAGVVCLTNTPAIMFASFNRWLTPALVLTAVIPIATLFLYLTST